MRKGKLAVPRILLTVVLSLGTIFFTAMDGIAEPIAANTEQLNDAYKDAGEATIFAAIKKYLGKDPSVWWILTRIINSIPGDSAQYETPQFDPAYASLTMAQLQERLGIYIVARNEVSKLAVTPGQLESLRVLDEEIKKMNAESKKRSGS